MIPPLPWGDPEAVIEGLRPVTDQLQYALDAGHAVCRAANDAANTLIGGPARASSMAEASMTRTFAIDYLKAKAPALGAALVEIPNDGLRFDLGACTLSTWKMTAKKGVPYPTTRARRRIIRQESLFGDKDRTEANLVLIYNPGLAGVHLVLVLPSGALEPGARPWDGAVATVWSAVLEHPADRDAREPVEEMADDDLPIERLGGTAEATGLPDAQ